jgi:glycine/D-amino acid oxidase-like deaminating enzyme
MVGSVGVQTGSWHDVASRSPWFEQLDTDSVPQPLNGDTQADVVIVGAGIAGVATAFFVLRETGHRVLLLERDRAGSGATGHNAGQVANYFERPLCELVDEYGFDRAIAAQAAIDDAFELLTLMVTESGSTVRLERVMGHMGMFSLNHLEIHLRNQSLRQRGGLSVEECVVADDAPFLSEIPAEYSGLFRVVPRADIEARLGRRCGQYYAVLSAPKACINSALVVEHAIAHLASAHPDRFRFADHTTVDRIMLGEGSAVVEAGGHHVDCRHVVLCTNGYLGHQVLDADGLPIELPLIQTVGFMGAYFEQNLIGPCAISYIKNERIGGDLPYGYVTRRTYDRPEGAATLTCVGGPETELDDGVRYDPDAMVPAYAVEQLDTQVRAVIDVPGGSCEAYDYTWHGLMGYMPDRLRVVGFEPSNPALLYNLACNGVGILPSLHGGQRIARLLAGHELPPSLFDPR